MIASLLAVTVAVAPLLAQSAASPSPAPSPSPAATASAPPDPGTLRVRAEVHTTFVTQTTRGPGTTPPEGAAFAQGSPAAPLTPYDTLSSAPFTPGNADESALFVNAVYATRSLTFGAQLGAGLVTGSITNATYWGEPLIPALNPHLGSQALPYAIVFPTGAGHDDGTGFVASVVRGEVATRNGHLRLRGGWFDLQQSDSFVFVQPPATNVVPQLAVQPPESLGDGPPNADFWSQAAPQLPLHGVDLVASSGIATAELTDAALPSLPGVGAQLHMASLVFDRGEGTRFSAQLAHVVTGGALVPTTILFAQGTQIDTPQGLLPSGFIGGQRQSIAGVRAAFHAFGLADATVEYGHSWYDADHVSLPGSQRPGNYYHAGVTRTFGVANVAFDYYANDPYYATAILPYGAPENVWSVAWSWPGQWLKSNYQLINDIPVNVDREGYRVKLALNGNVVSVRVAYANFGEIVPITVSNANRTGFVDGFFLPEADGAATLGRQNQYAIFARWHTPWVNLTADWTEDAIRRPALPGSPRDLVDYHTPVYTLGAYRQFTPSLLVSAGYAQYAMNGAFGQGYDNVNFAQRQGYAAAEYRESAHAATLVSLRRSAFSGYAIAPGDLPPDFTGTMLILEQRVHL